MYRCRVVKLLPATRKPFFGDLRPMLLKKRGIESLLFPVRTRQRRTLLCANDTRRYSDVMEPVRSAALVPHAFRGGKGKKAP
jgi:hypothetical protein